MGSTPVLPRRLLSASELRRLISRLKGCLASLPRRQARALVLRSGLGLEQSYSRRRVARILQVSLKQEGQIERRAMTGLIQASRQGRCGDPMTSIRATVLHAAGLLLGLTRGTALLEASSAGAGASSASGASSAEPRGAGSQSRSGAGPQPRSGAVGRTQSGPQPAVGLGGSAAISPPAQGNGFNWLLLLVVLTLALAALWLGFSWLRTHTGGASVASWPGWSRRNVSLAAARGVPAIAANGAVTNAAESASATAAGIEAFDRGAALVEKGDLAGAEFAFRRAEEQGHPSAASNLGVLLEGRGDVAGAEAAYRRSDAQGDATGAFNLGSMLADRGDVAGAEAAYRRADERGDAVGAFNLGAMLEERNDVAAAGAAYRRALERGGAGDVADLARAALSRLRTPH